MSALIVIATTLVTAVFFETGRRWERREWLRRAHELFALREAKYREAGLTYRAPPICSTCGFALPQRPEEERSPWFPTPAYAPHEKSGGRLN